MEMVVSPWERSYGQWTSPLTIAKVVAVRMFEQLDEAILANRERSFAFLERLVAASSTVGNEGAALDTFAEQMTELGFATTDLPFHPGLADDPIAGAVQAVSGPRRNTLARKGTGGSPSLLLHGHIDVVPAEWPHLWTSPPFEPSRRDGWLYGRGAGDMKCGFAMGALALMALHEVTPDFPNGQLSFLAAVEEECTGNGTLSACRQGVLADAVIALEPTGLDLMVGGIGILWCDVTVEGHPTHAHTAHESANAFTMLQRLADALHEWGGRLNAEFPDPVLEEVDSPYNINVGQISGGDWPSSGPASATMRVRIGYPREWTPVRAESEVRGLLASTAGALGLPRDPGVVLSGFRAKGYWLSPKHPLAVALSAAHVDAHGVEPRAYSLGSTTDARFYVNDFHTPAICFGPTVRNIHGLDESVELDSITRGARTLARFLSAWFSDRSES